MSSCKLSQLFVEYNCFKCLSAGVSSKSKLSSYFIKQKFVSGQQQKI